MTYKPPPIMRILSMISILILAALACNAPTAGGDIAEATQYLDEIATIVAETAVAALTATADGGDTVDEATAEIVDVPTDTAEPKPTDTPGPTNTPGTAGCSNNSAFVSDVTIPDDTVVLPGQTIVKTWRVNNNGSCTWSTSYQFAFISGAQMGAPGSINLPQQVNQGSNLDLSITFVAPTTPGTYTSTWQLRTPTGEVFGTKPYVRIIVPAPTGTPTHTPTITQTSAASATATPLILILQTLTPTPSPTLGGILIDPVAQAVLNPVSPTGQVSSGGSIANPPNVGDRSDNTGLQGFLTFNLAEIPTTATVTGVSIEFVSFDTLGDPFGGLGCLRIYPYNFGPTLDAGDYFTGTASGAQWRFCSVAEVNSVSNRQMENVSTVQAALGGTFQIRLQFNQTATNNNNVADVFRPTMRLVVAYTP